MWNFKQIIKRKIGDLIDCLRKNEAIQTVIDDRYNRPGHIPVSECFLDNVFYLYNGYYFKVNDQTDSIFETTTHYEYNDINPTDIVLDIGANNGSFSIFASKNAKHVYAVEPIYPDLVQQNIEKNKIKNITVLGTGLGSGVKKIRYGKINKTVSCKSLSEIISLCGNHIDFLKIDCEGGEWSIKPHELNGIRRIEGEIHNLDGFHDVNNFITMLKQVGFNCRVHRFSDVIIIVHAERSCK